MKISIGLLPVWRLDHGDANFQARFCISIYQSVTGRRQEINFKRQVTDVPE